MCYEIIEEKDPIMAEARPQNRAVGYSQSGGTISLSCLKEMPSMESGP